MFDCISLLTSFQDNKLLPCHPLIAINFYFFLYEFMNLNVFDGFQLIATIFLSESTLAGLCPARASSAQLLGFSCQVPGHVWYFPCYQYDKTFWTRVVCFQSKTGTSNFSGNHPSLQEALTVFIGKWDLKITILVLRMLYVAALITKCLRLSMDRTKTTILHTYIL